MVGIFLMSLGAGRLSESSASHLAYFGGAAAVAVLVQMMVIWRHNRRVGQELRDEALSTSSPGAGN